jgi:hypothetical protein
VLSRFGNSTNSTIRRRTAQLFCIRPGTTDDLGGIVELAKPQSQTPWPLLIVGEAYYRAGRFQDAVNAFAGGRPFTVGLYHQALTTSFEAMAQHALGNKEAASRSLAESKLVLDQLPKPGGDAPNVSWHDAIMCRMAYREAESLLSGSAPGKSND